MKKLLQVFVISIFLFTTQHLKAEVKKNFVDSTTCCTPDSLKIVSNIGLRVCFSWVAKTDTSCHTPYGFSIQTAVYPGSGPWTEHIVLYTPGATQNYCDTIDTCGRHQWRVRTICLVNGVFTYSDWVYGNKFVVDCGGRRTNADDPHNILNIATKTPALQNKRHLVFLLQGMKYPGRDIAAIISGRTLALKN